MNPEQELYQQVILSHNRTPKNFGKPSEATHSTEGYNPLCGDHYNVYLQLGDDEKIKGVYFEGSGCAISKASASIMTQKLQGMSKEQAAELIALFNELILGNKKELTEEEEQLLGELTLFTNIWKYPSRVKCALLSWHAVKGALGGEQTVSTE